MNPRKQIFLAGLLSLILCGFGLAAYLESDSGGFTETPGAGEHVIRRAPNPAAPVKSLISSVTIGRPTRYRNLTVYPLESRRSGALGIKTLSEALDRKWITIKEQDTAQVNEISVQNRSRHRVFLMAGEIITGGKQNRVIKNDVLLPPESGLVHVPVYCVEKDRWAGREVHFRIGNAIASDAVRHKAVESASQDAIWDKVRDEIIEAEVTAPTHDYYSIYEDKEVAREIDECVTKFRNFCGRRTVGAVVVSQDHIMSCDIFQDPALMEEMWDKICRSYALKTLNMPELRRRDYLPVSEDEVARFVERVLSADVTTKKTSGEGASMSFVGSLSGEALTWRDNVVHAVLFPTVTVLIRPEPVEREPIYRTEDKLWR